MKKITDIPDVYHPGFSINCVIIGFFDGCLKILLNKFKSNDFWFLPGGYIYKNENMDDAASRILCMRTGLTDPYLKQFHTFGDTDRYNKELISDMLKKAGIEETESHWLNQRFISVGYYALVNCSKTQANSIYDNEIVEWHDYDKMPPLYSDHNKIVYMAIEHIRGQIGIIPIGYQLLPPKFTMPELRSIYEAIIGKQLDRRNFQRKMLSVGLITRLDETRNEGLHKAPYLYSFRKDRYALAFDYGIPLMSWNSKDW